jgi:hypothetical protein
MELATPERAASVQCNNGRLRLLWMARSSADLAFVVPNSAQSSVVLPWLDPSLHKTRIRDNHCPIISSLIASESSPCSRGVGSRRYEKAQKRHRRGWAWVLQELRLESGFLIYISFTSLQSFNYGVPLTLCVERAVLSQSRSPSAAHKQTS